MKTIRTPPDTASSCHRKDSKMLVVLDSFDWWKENDSVEILGAEFQTNRASKNLNMFYITMYIPVPSNRWFLETFSLLLESASWGLHPLKQKVHPETSTKNAATRRFLEPNDDPAQIRLLFLGLFQIGLQHWKLLGRDQQGQVEKRPLKTSSLRAFKDGLTV